MRAPLDLTDIEKEKREREGEKKRKYNIQPEDSLSFAKYAGPASHQTVAGSFSLDSRPSSSRLASIPDYRKSITDGPLRTRSWKSSAVRAMFSKHESGETRRRGAIRDGRSHLNIVARRMLVFSPWTFEGNSTSFRKMVPDWHLAFQGAWFGIPAGATCRDEY